MLKKIIIMILLLGITSIVLRLYIVDKNAIQLNEEQTLELMLNQAINSKNNTNINVSTLKKLTGTYIDKELNNTKSNSHITASLYFLGFYYFNINGVVDYCSQQAVDLSDFKKKFIQQHKKEYKLTQQYLKNNGINVEGFHKQLRSAFIELALLDIESLADDMSAETSNICTWYNDLEKEYHYSIIEPDIYKYLPN